MWHDLGAQMWRLNLNLDQLNNNSTVLSILNSAALDDGAQERCGQFFGQTAVVPSKAGWLSQCSRWLTARNRAAG